MGWLQIARALTSQSAEAPIHISSLKEPSVQHVESVNVPYSPQYKFASTSTSNDKLPFISAAEVAEKRRPGALSSSLQGTSASDALWIVVDNVVYDCTSFIHEHPGGIQVVLSFIGEDCSWQFWRFHGKQHMEEYGRPLRIGRTEGVGNRFPEPTRFVGLRRFGSASDDWDQ